MKSLFTRLTENIGDSLAQNINKNLLNIYSLASF